MGSKVLWTKTRILSCCILILISSSVADAHHEPMIDYSVVRGDTLIGLCRQNLEYPKKWREIAKINGMRNPERIYPGQVVRIRMPCIANDLSVKVRPWELGSSPT